MCWRDERRREPRLQSKFGRAFNFQLPGTEREGEKEWRGSAGGKRGDAGSRGEEGWKAWKGEEKKVKEEERRVGRGQGGARGSSDMGGGGAMET